MGENDSDALRGSEGEIEEEGSPERLSVMVPGAVSEMVDERLKVRDILLVKDGLGLPRERDGLGRVIESDTLAVLV